MQYGTSTLRRAAASTVWKLHTPRPRRSVVPCGSADSGTAGSGLPGSWHRLPVFFDFQLHSKRLKPVGRVLDVSSAALRPICLCIKPTRLLHKSISETKAIYIIKYESGVFRNLSDSQYFRGRNCDNLSRMSTNEEMGDNTLLEVEECGPWASQHGKIAISCLVGWIQNQHLCAQNLKSTPIIKVASFKRATPSCSDFLNVFGHGESTCSTWQAHKGLERNSYIGF